MFKIIVFFLSFISVQVYAKQSTVSLKSNLAYISCSKGQIAFILDNKKLCLDIEAPIVESNYYENENLINRYISNINSESENL